jgi:HEAT repeat protein
MALKLFKPVFWTFVALGPAAVLWGTPLATDADAKAKEALKHRQAIHTLVDQKDPTGAPALKEGLSDKDPMVREMSIQGLHALNAADNAGLIAALLVKDPDPGVREEAALALKEWNEPSTLAAVLHGSSDPVVSVRVICLEALSSSPSPAAHQAIVRAAKDPAPEVRRTVMSLFAHASDPALVPILTAALSDVDPAVRANAAQAIGFFAKLQTPKELKDLLNDPDDAVRASAARSLAQKGDPQGVATALTLIQSSDHTARLIAVDALGYAHDDDAKVALADLIAKDGDPYVRESAKLSLKRAHFDKK